MSQSSSLMAGSRGVRDEGLHNFGERAVVIPDTTTGDVVSSGIAEDLPEDFSLAEQEVGREVLANFLSNPAVYPSQSALRKSPPSLRRVTGEGDDYGEMVRPKGGEGGPCHIGEEMPAEKSDIWRERLALGAESSREILVRNSKLQTVDCSIKSLLSGRCPVMSVISGSREPGGMVGIRVAKHHLGSSVLQKSAKVRDVVPRAEGRKGGCIH